MALFEVATVVSAAAAVVPAVTAARAWIAAKRKRRITVTLSDGEELTIKTTQGNTDKVLQLLAKVQEDELAAPDGSLPGGGER